MFRSNPAGKSPPVMDTLALSCKLAVLHPPHQIIEIDRELFGPADIVLELLDVGARELGRRIAGRLGGQLHHRGVLQHDHANDRLRDARADRGDAVVLEQHRAVRTERLGDARAHLVGADQVDRISVDAQRLVEQRSRLAVAAHRPAGCRERDGIGRMGVDHAMHVGAQLEDFRVDVDLAVAACGAGDHVTVEVDGEDVLRRDFVEPQTVRLHEEPRRIVGQPK